MIAYSILNRSNICNMNIKGISKDGDVLNCLIESEWLAGLERDLIEVFGHP